ncbi:hypothetical protein [Terribacillus saccharophilus]|uniref:hypothetical protein n=1 Tax=Terribacillus saccharophilus TaxID=361277 RepID=UPI003D2C4A70
MQKDLLLQLLKQQGDSFHFYSSFSNDSAEQQIINSAKLLEEDGIIVLEICKATKLENSPVVKIKGYFA